ncbi:NAD(P)H-hydrate dehydratase [Laribacter hongkongensis]|uniref:NAD(P)H-hydrate dehydratase n=1 Tax=Laribacter hongkongensis TaxID=168471 RepID=UPI001EFC5251|nr:NAD(P)H-hydrate dehydratase [Laribacter hongkongensis]MCG9055023.1 NAD(P)H-hydrate dehydratase [Laribacter hongkongensis]
MNPVRPIFSATGLRMLESRAEQAGMPLMDRAAGLIATHVEQHFPDRPVVAVAGRGNNGGDAILAAARLACRGIPAAIRLPLGTPDTAAARQVLEQARQAGVRLLQADEDWPETAVLLDGLFGIGLTRAPEGEAAQAIERINAHPGPVVAIDLPSGLDAERGVAYAPCVRAQHTLTFLADKTGLLTADGPDHAGEVFVHALDLPPDWLPDPVAACYVPPEPWLPPRRHNSNKGVFGGVGIIGGAEGMTGAVLLAARAALRHGAGKVRGGFVAPFPALDSLYPELMLARAEAVLAAPDVSVLAVGPGLGCSTEAGELLARALACRLPLVLDADALNLLAQDPALAEACRQRGLPTILTPHPGEAARLLATGTASIQADRPEAVRQLARNWQAVVVLKGCGTLVAGPDGFFTVNPTGHPGLAQAGQGDTLTGMIAALLAQGLDAAAAARLAVWLHGRHAGAIDPAILGRVPHQAAD